MSSQTLGADWDCAANFLACERERATLGAGPLSDEAFDFTPVPEPANEWADAYRHAPAGRTCGSRTSGRGRSGGRNGPLMYRPDGVKVIEYDEYPIERFAGWLGHRRSNPKQDDERRVAAIKTVLNGGAPAVPVWIEKHQVDLDPLPVREGHHRLLAFAELGLPLVPVSLVKYDDELGAGKTTAPDSKAEAFAPTVRSRTYFKATTPARRLIGVVSRRVRGSRGRPGRW